MSAGKRFAAPAWKRRVLHSAVAAAVSGFVVAPASAGGPPPVACPASISDSSHSSCELDGTTSFTVTSAGVIDRMANGHTVGAVTINGQLAAGVTLTNNGTIRARGTATYVSGIGIWGTPWDDSAGTLTNSGTISATNDSGYGATGVYVLGGLSGTLSNRGIISATNNNGSATGVDLNGLSGTLTNSGSISAIARGNAGAMAVGVRMGGLTGTLNNSGTISATAPNIADAYSLKINAGTGTVNNLAGGLLSGNLSIRGAVAVNNAGTIYIPAGAAATIDGVYTQLPGGILQIGAASAASYGQLSATSGVAFAGSNTIAIHVTVGNTLAAGDKLDDVLTAGAWVGLASGGAVNVIGTPLFSFTGVEDGAGHIDVTVAAKYSFAGVLGSSGALGTLGGALDGLSGTGPMAPLMEALYGLNSRAELEAAAQQLLPQSGLGLATGDALHSINRVIQSRQDANRGMASGDEFFGDRNFWFKPFNSRADQGEHNGVSGYLARTAGLAFGVDGTLSDATRVGGAFTYSRTDVNAATAAQQTGDVAVYQAIFYGSHKLDDRTALDFQADCGITKNNASRQIALLGSTATSNYDGWATHLGAGVGRSHALNADTTFVPSVRADYTYLHTDGYTETGAGAAGLKVDASKTDELILGVDGTVVHTLDNGVSLVGNLGAGYDALSKRASITASFVGGGPVFSTQGLDPSPWMLRAGAGLVVASHQGTEVTVRYDVESRSSSFTNQTISLRARVPF